MQKTKFPKSLVMLQLVEAWCEVVQVEIHWAINYFKVRRLSLSKYKFTRKSGILEEKRIDSFYASKLMKDWYLKFDIINGRIIS